MAKRVRVRVTAGDVLIDKVGADVIMRGGHHVLDNGAHDFYDVTVMLPNQVSLSLHMDPDTTRELYRNIGRIVDGWDTMQTKRLGNYREGGTT